MKTEKEIYDLLCQYRLAEEDKIWKDDSVEKERMIIKIKLLEWILGSL